MQCFFKILKGKGLLYQNKFQFYSPGVQRENVILFWTFMAISATWGVIPQKIVTKAYTPKKRNVKKEKKQVNKCI